MTKDEADKAVAEAKEAVIAAAKKLSLDGGNMVPLGSALYGLTAAEAARAALDKPRLMTPEERAAIRCPGSSIVGQPGVAWAIADDRADILAKAKLRAQAVSDDIAEAFGERRGENPVKSIGLSDLAALLEGR